MHNHPSGEFSRSPFAPASATEFDFAIPLEESHAPALAEPPADVIEAVVAYPATAQPDVVPSWAMDSLDSARMLFHELRENCRHVVQGRDAVIDFVLTSLFADGHVLLEDHPGSGKTTLAKTLGESIRRSHDGDFAAFRRVQFTPDLMPSDITGTTMFSPETGGLSFHPGPIFTNVLLADEINRTSPKVQAALLEAMGEKQVTIDNRTHPLEHLFFVIATQNPLDLVGTYPLPRAQLDRFLFKIRMTYLPRDSELEVLTKWRGARRHPRAFRVAPDTIIAARRIIQDHVRVSPAINECLVDIAQALRHDSRIVQGISTRSLVLAIPALQAWAMMHGRDFISHQDIKDLAVPLFAHRMELVPGVKNGDAVVLECIQPILEQAVRRTLR